MQKPTKPSVTLPDSFGGTKYEFDADRLLSGYKEGVKDVVDGGNLNYLIDGIGQIVNYNKQITDFIRDMPIGKITTVDTNNNLVYGENKMTLPVGSLQSSTLPLMDNIQYVLADGTQYSTTGVYQAFADYLAQVKLTHPQCFVTQAEFDADVASIGQCGRYVLDTVNFRVPKITRYIGATVNLADIGKAWGESLPNITGATSLITGGNDMFDYGAFYKDSVNKKAGIFGASSGTNSVNAFDASRSSSTYQDGAKVNPERVTYPYYIVVSNAGQMTPVEIDINNVMADLALKADKDLDNTIPSQAFKEQSVGWGMPDYSTGVVKSSSGFTSDKKQWLKIQKDTQGYVITVYVNGQIVDYGGIGGSTSIRSTETNWVLIDDNDVITTTIGTNATLTLTVYPMKGVN